MNRIKAKEAIPLIIKISEEEEIREEASEGLFFIISDNLKGKVTLHTKFIFEQKIREIFKRNKEQLNDNNYLEVANKIQELFRDGTTQSFINRRGAILAIIVPSVTTILLFVIQLFTK